MTAVRPPDFLVHDEAESVGVATRELPPGPVTGGYLVGSDVLEIEITEPIPLGHKFALATIAEGRDVLEYGVGIGVATRPISLGEHVHIHNLRSARWQSSVAG
jgi:(2R)-sulfolactate sulfo-lyase subunit alpha